MYHSDYNRPPNKWDQESNNWERQVQARRVKKSNKSIVGIALSCALVGGLIGSGSVLLAQNVFRGATVGTTVLYQGLRPETVVALVEPNGQKLEANQIYSYYVNSTVGITTEVVTTNYFGQPVTAAAAGSGFVVSEDGYIMTNHHVIENANSIQVSFVDGTTYDATLVGSEAENDIAILKIDANGLTPVVMGNSDEIQVGEEVVAIGNPLGELTFSMTSGIISAKDRSISLSSNEVMNMIQTDTAINSGNSGGPLFDMYGRVIGLTTAKHSGTSASGSAIIEGLGFAIPVNDIMDMVQDIIEHGYVTGKAYMGITVSTIPLTDAETYGISPGALVQSVDSVSCSAKAGLEKGDIIIGFNDVKIASSADLIEAKKEYKAGETVSLTVERKGQQFKTELTFDEDSPARRQAQAELQAELEAQQVEKNQQSQENQQNTWPNQSDDYFWPFSGMFPWFY